MTSEQNTGIPGATGNGPDVPGGDEVTETVDIVVNENVVVVPKGSHTADTILAAAKSQGVNVAENFVVQIEFEGQDDIVMVGSIEITETIRFSAIRNDDNS